MSRNKNRTLHLPTSPSTQEQTMEATPQATEPTAEKVVEPVVETAPQGPTAKEMAAAEEANLARIQAQIKAEQERAEREAEEPISIMGLAAKGRETLLEGLRQHQERAKPVEYVPPPRTERQMSALQAELEAGRRAQQRAEAQQANRPAPEPPKANDGFTTPVYRPDNMVPDPMMGNGAHGGGVYQPITEK